MLASAPRLSIDCTTYSLPRQAAVHSVSLTPSSHAFKGKSSLLGTSSMADPKANKYATTSVQDKVKKWNFGGGHIFVI